MENAWYPRISGKIIDVRDRKLLNRLKKFSLILLHFMRRKSRDLSYDFG